jgi:hypothetical protein
MHADITRNDIFVPTTISVLRDIRREGVTVKLYAMFVRVVDTASALIHVEDECDELHVDYSIVDIAGCKVGEWYRWLGEVRYAAGAGEAPFLKLCMSPVFIESFDQNEYEKSLSVRTNFISDFNSLISYACKHK